MSEHAPALPEDAAGWCRFNEQKSSAEKNPAKIVRPLQDVPAAARTAVINQLVRPVPPTARGGKAAFP